MLRSQYLGVLGTPGQKDHLSSLSIITCSVQTTTLNLPRAWDIGPAVMTENANSNTLNEGQSISFSYHNLGVKGTGLIGKFLGIGVTGLLSALGSLGCIAVWASQKADSEMEVGMQSPHLWKRVGTCWLSTGRSWAVMWSQTMPQPSLRKP